MNEKLLINFTEWIKENCYIENNMIYYIWSDGVNSSNEIELINLFKYDLSKKQFPIYYKGKNYYPKDCDEMFLNVYSDNDRDCLNTDSGIYMCGGQSIYPDGEINDYF